jgi:ATP-dependent protease ClpP protease subunit
MMRLLSIIALLLAANFAIADTKEIALTKDNFVVMDKEFTAESSAEIAIKLRAADRKLPAGQPLYLILNTPGGSIFAGLELIENINSMSRRVDTITIFAASMGFQTVQQLKGIRYIVGNGTLMSHKGRVSWTTRLSLQIYPRSRY